MSDDAEVDGDDVSHVEDLLRELELGDLDLARPPAHVWEGIERRLAADGEPGSVIELDRRRGARRRWTITAVAAAASVAAVVAGVALVGGDDGSEVLISSAELLHDPDAFDPLGTGASAVAELIEHDGRFEIRLVDPELPAAVPDADLELWLIQPDAAGNPIEVEPVALIDGAGPYRVPDDLDPATHYVVDISIEPRDGDQAHSGRSILRGALRAV